MPLRNNRSYISDGDYFKYQIKRRGAFHSTNEELLLADGN
jgi:hypothetical protein